MSVQVLAGTHDFARLAAAPVHRPFDEGTLDFLAVLAERLHRHPLAAAHVDVVGLAYFCRRSHLEALRAQHAARLGSAVGRGLSFHIAPSNVPINFAYSLVLGLVTGNTCLVRTSSKDFAETRIVCEVLEAVLGDARFVAMRDRLSVVRYGHDRALNDQFSALCDARLIWGGDATIAEIRRSPLSPRAVELAFADRYSACVIDAVGYLAAPNKQALALGFYADTYRNHQAACTAPRLVYWLGDDASVAAAKQGFWRELDAVLSAKGETSAAIDSVDKLTTFCRLALAMPSATVAPAPELRIARITVGALDPALMRFVCNGGLFVEFAAPDLGALAAFATPKLQTVTYLGTTAERLAHELAFAGIKGVDRVVPSGAASSFELTWDGYDLVAALTRHVVVR